MVLSTQQIDHLGYHIDSTEMVTLTEDKFTKLHARAYALLDQTQPTIGQVVTFLGTVEACTVAVQHGNLHKHVRTVQKRCHDE